MQEGCVDEALLFQVGQSLFFSFFFLTSSIKAEGLKAFYWCKGAFANCSVLYVENVLHTEKSLHLNRDQLGSALGGRVWRTKKDGSCAPVFLLPLPTVFLLLCFKGIFKLHFLADSEWNVRENWVTGLCFRREAQPETKKNAHSAPLESLSHVKVTSNGKQYQSKHPPALI